MSAKLHFDRASGSEFTYRTPWGEQYRIRAGSDVNGSRCSVLDYTAPLDFGVVKHIHREQEESLYVLEGRLAVWTPEQTFLLGPGDFTCLPPGVPHAWRSYGDTRIRILVILSEGTFESFFPLIEERHLTLDRREELTEVASIAGLDLTGPPLSEDEFQEILNNHAQI